MSDNTDLMAEARKTASEVMRTHVNVVRAASSDYVHELEVTAGNPDAGTAARVGSTTKRGR